MKKLDERIILFYKFVPVIDPDMTRNWQRELCARLGLKGRVIINEHGINGTLGGPVKSLREYKKAMTETGTFKGIQYKWSDGGAKHFPKLSVKVRAELVTLEPNEEFDVFNQGTALTPRQWHDYLEQNPDAIVLDARNEYESNIGTFKTAIKPKIKNFRDIKPELEKLPKDKPVLTYCTGDIRCEYLTAYMKHSGFEDVYHLDGGIAKYGEEFGDDGHWEGKLYVFDKRMNIGFSDKAKDIAVCVHCGKNTSRQENCSVPDCHLQTVMCTECSKKYSGKCFECLTAKPSKKPKVSTRRVVAR